MINGIGTRTYISQFVAPTSDGGLKAYEVYGYSPQEISMAVSLFREWNDMTQSPMGKFHQSAKKVAEEHEKDIEEIQVEIDSLSRSVGNISDPEKRLDAEAYLELLQDKQRKIADMLQAAIAAETKLRD